MFYAFPCFLVSLLLFQGPVLPLQANLLYQHNKIVPITVCKVHFLLLTVCLYLLPGWTLPFTSPPGDRNEDTNDQHARMPSKKALCKGKEGPPQNMAPKAVKPAHTLTLTTSASRPHHHVKYSSQLSLLVCTCLCCFPLANQFLQHFTLLAVYIHCFLPPCHLHAAFLLPVCCLLATLPLSCCMWFVWSIASFIDVVVICSVLYARIHYKYC